MSDNDHLQFGYAKFERGQLLSLNLSHLLYENVDLPPYWNLALEGYAYGEVLHEMGAQNEARSTFTFDRVNSTNQSEAVKQHISDFVGDVDITYKGSRKEGGIQTADCFAGAVAEDLKRGTDWLSNISDSRITESSYSSLVQLEHRLHEYDTGP
ncbi:hypothetical protein Hbl1158_02855 [Halobaculum sp. CBA1158]|uniref:hypothetical protein n=1 Tax=Halobaculum sp. CBA1158 TaxID=2904243 RepID=UPI001F35AED5|nr:hypothetical protein [Halobaculum sp. CBA1158]UIP00326.1 hypothetical protein Hbl1158_02855 [Halobaculum sp. CBA1158]